MDLNESDDGERDSCEAPWVWIAGKRVKVEPRRREQEAKPLNENAEEARLTEFAKSEVALINRLIGNGLGPEATREQRKDMQAILGHAYRLGGMLMETHQGRARKTKAGRAARLSNKQERDQIIDTMLRAKPDKTVGQIKHTIDKELERCGLARASTSHLYKRQRKTLSLTDEES